MPLPALLPAVATSAPVAAKAASIGAGAKTGSLLASGMKALGMAGAQGLLSGVTSGAAAAADSRLGFMLGRKSGSYSQGAGSSAVQSVARRAVASTEMRMQQAQNEFAARENELNRAMEIFKTNAQLNSNEAVEGVRSATAVRTAQIMAGPNEKNAAVRQAEYDQSRLSTKRPLLNRIDDFVTGGQPGYYEAVMQQLLNMSPIYRLYKGMQK